MRIVYALLVALMVGLVVVGVVQVFAGIATAIGDVMTIQK